MKRDTNASGSFVMYTTSGFLAPERIVDLAKTVIVSLQWWYFLQ